MFCCLKKLERNNFFGLMLSVSSCLSLLVRSLTLLGIINFFVRSALKFLQNNLLMHMQSDMLEKLQLCR